jgi:hypothetical protein
MTTLQSEHARGSLAAELSEPGDAQTSPARGSHLTERCKHG